MSFQSDAEAASGVTVAGTQRSALFYNSATNTWYSKNQAGVSNPLGGGPVQWVNAVTNIGLDNTGTNDNSSTLNTYLAANNLQVLYFPAGTYKFASTITVANSFIFIGDGINATNFETTSATADMFTYPTNWYNKFSQINFKSTVTRTAGYALNFGTTDYVHVENCQFTSMFSCINLGGNLCLVSNCFFAGTQGNGINVTGAANNSYIYDCTWAAQGSIAPGNGINVTQCGSLLISNCDIISMASGLSLAPVSPNGVFSVQATNCFFDTCTNGVSFTGTGNIQRCSFTECWLGDSTNGFSSTNTATTPPSGIIFTGCLFFSNSASGMVCTDMADFNVVGCQFGGNPTSGITVSAAGTAATRFTIVGNNMGTMGGLAGSTTGILINAGTYGSYVIEGNTIIGNTTAINDGGSVSGQNQKTIQNNIGAMLQGKVAQIVAASAGLAATETIVVGGLNVLPIPANSLMIGQVIRVTLFGTCTSTAANATTFRVRLGTAGTTADTAILTAATPTAATTGTTIPFQAILTLTVRTLGAAATCSGHLDIRNQSGAAVGTASTGIMVIPTQIVSGTAATFSTTTANYLSVTHQTGAATTTNTFQEAFVEIL